MRGLLIRWKQTWPFVRPFMVVLGVIVSLTTLKLVADWLNGQGHLDVPNRFFGAQRYTPLDFCLNSDPTILWTYWILDMTTFVSDVLLGATLLINRSKVERFIRLVYHHPPSVLLFGAAFVSNGAIQYTESLTLTVGVYYLDIIVSAACAAISMAAAAFVLWSFYGPTNLPQVNEGLAETNPRVSDSAG